MFTTITLVVKLDLPYIIVMIQHILLVVSHLVVVIKNVLMS